MWNHVAADKNQGEMGSCHGLTSDHAKPLIANNWRDFPWENGTSPSPAISTSKTDNTGNGAE